MEVLRHKLLAHVQAKVLRREWCSAEGWFSAVEAGAWAGYDADAMHGLPVGVQIVGRRYEEEKVIEGMKLVERLLADAGDAYQRLEI